MSSPTSSFTFIIPVNNEDVFKNNFLASPLFRESHSHQIIVQHGFDSAAIAYNAAIECADNDLLIFVHQDVVLPDCWVSNLKVTISYLANENSNWGVLGCFGSRKGSVGGIGQVYTTGMGIHGRAIDIPEPVETLDEIVLIIKKSSGLKFDPTLPHYHLYGTDICLSARERGMLSYSIPAFCIHNTNQLIDLPKEFFECYYHIKRHWTKYLPIFTSCITISRFDRDIFTRRCQRAFSRILRKSKQPLSRMKDPVRLLKNLIEELPK